MDEKKAPDIPYIAFEDAMVRAERDKKRLWIVILILIAALLATNIGWIWYESQFETVYWEQDGDGLNNMNTGGQGDVIYEPERKVQTETVWNAEGD